MSVEPLKESHQNLSFQKSKNPKIPTQVSDFWKLEEFAQNPKKPKIPRVSKNPKIQKSQPQFRIFGNSRNLLKIQKNPKFLEFPKIQKSKNPKPSFGFLETRGICSKSKKTQNSSSFQKSKKTQPKFRIFGNSRNLLKIQKNPKFLEFPKIKKSKNPTPVSDFWKLEEFAQNPKKPKIPRVSKNPKLGLGFLDCWIFGNSRNFGLFWILSKFLEFPKIRNLGWDFWIFGFLKTRGILEWCSSPPPPPLPGQIGNTIPGSVEGGG